VFSLGVAPMPPRYGLLFISGGAGRISGSNGRSGDGAAGRSPAHWDGGHRLQHEANT